MLAMAGLGGLSGCDTRPKIVMPTKIPPIPKKFGTGGGRALPAKPEAEEPPPAAPAPGDKES
jgi:hypothetical protein